MWLGDLPDEIKEYANSGYQSSKNGMMVKEPTKHPRSRCSSKNLSQGKEKSKCKFHPLKDKYGDQYKRRKRRGRKAVRTEGCNASTEADTTEVSNFANTDVVQEQTAGEGVEHEQGPLSLYLKYQTHTTVWWWMVGVYNFPILQRL